MVENNSNVALQMYNIVRALNNLRSNLAIAKSFPDQVAQVKKLLRNDSTGLVGTIYDMMVNTASVPVQIESKNPTIDQVLSYWQNSLLNKDINIDIPRGLRNLSKEYFKERWSSSFIGLKINWSKQTIGGKIYILPTDMWFIDGASLRVTGSESDLSKRKYFIGKNVEQTLANTATTSIIIRKPFSSWYEGFPTPYFVHRGVLFNSFLKNAILYKQSDIIEAMIPYLLLLKSGSDKLAELEMLTPLEDLKELKNKIIQAQKEFDQTGEIGKLMATLSYDVNFEHLTPDFKKIFDADITKACDKNILAGLGMIELQGFSKDREEMMLNPKVLVEEVKSGVADWKSLLEEVMFQFVDKNKEAYPTLMKNQICINPQTIRTFITDKQKDLILRAFGNGPITYQTLLEDVFDKEFDAEKTRREDENTKNYDLTFYPHLIQNVEQYPNDPSIDPSTLPAPIRMKPTKPAPKKAELKYCEMCNEELDPILTPTDGGICPCCGTPIQGSLEKIQAPYNSIDQLPPAVKKHLPIPAQLQFMRVVNEALKRGLSDSEAFREAWGIIKKSFEKSPSGKWKKKGSDNE